MFSFQWPWLIGLFPIPLLITYFWPCTRIEQPSPQLRFPTLHRLEQAFSTKISAVTQPRWQKGMLWLGWLALVIALMSPQWLDKQIEITETGYDLMLAVDLSGSMAEGDFYTRKRQRITRLEAVKQVLGPFIQNRLGDRIGLILFADQAYLQSPLTLDNHMVHNLLTKATIGMAGRDTAIGDAIGLAVKKLRERPEESRVLILLTDGENNTGTLAPLQAAKLAKQYNIQIYTIGVGRDSRLSGQGANENTLRQLAELTKGDYFSAHNLNALVDVYDHIDKTLRKTKAESRTYIKSTPLYRWPLGIALVILLLYFMILLKYQ